MSKLDREYNKYVAYQIFPLSFKDTNGDGYGDLNGIREELPYIKSLGIDMIWLCPIFASPMEDSGYDVSDYFKINPLLGDMDDMRKLLDEAHKLNIKVIIDFVVNHTSSEHVWFKKALSDPNSKEHGFYYFKKGRIGPNGEKLPPNNWQGFFSTSCWEYVPELDEYYFHIFGVNMPDLNYTNKDLLDEIEKVGKFWIDFGVDGFRLDAIAHLAKDTTFKDSDKPANAEGLVYDYSKFSNRPELINILRELNERIFKKYGVFTVGEVGGGITAEGSISLADVNNGVMNMVFNFDTNWHAFNGDPLYLDINKDLVTDVYGLKTIFKKWYDICYKDCDMPVYWLNHDHPRVLSHYGDVKFRKESGKMLCITLLFLYGLPFILYGEELGMSNLNYTDINDYIDVNDINHRKELVGVPEKNILQKHNLTSRSNGRQPFLWKNARNAGFSSGKPWMKVASYYPECNEEDEDKDPDSILNFYRKAIKLRHDEEILKSICDNPFELYDVNHPDVFAYTHIGENMNIMVISNFRGYEVKQSVDFSKYEILLHNYEDVKFENKTFTLRPYESYLIRLIK